MPAPNTPHFNWGIDFPGTVTSSNYSTWATKGKGPDCTWITFCTSCCPPPGTGPDCCCVSNGSAAIGGASEIALKAAHPPDAPQPRVVHWCKHPYCPYKPAPPPLPGPPTPAPPGVPNCSAVAKPGPICKCGANPKTGGPGGGYPGTGYCWDCQSCGSCSGCGTCKKCWQGGPPPPPPPPSPPTPGVMCQPNMNPPQFCPGGIKCPACGKPACPCPHARPLAGPAPPPLFNNSVPVFWSGSYFRNGSVRTGGLNGSMCFRIPTVIKTSTGSLLAFAENRAQSDCRGDSDQGVGHSIAMRRSTTNGATWGPMVTVQTRLWDGVGATGPNPVEVRMGPSGKRAILLHFELNESTHVSTRARHGTDCQLWSFDDGRNWQNLSALKYAGQPNLGGEIGPAAGIQDARGRIYFTSNSNALGQFPFLYWSDTFGHTWKASPSLPRQYSDVGECGITFLVSERDGRILMNCRTGRGHRAVSVWSAEGVLSNISFPTSLQDPGCQGSVVNEAGVIYQSNANTSRPSCKGKDRDCGRNRMAIKKSVDGKTWLPLADVWQGPSAYSQLVALGEQRLGLLFEAGASNPYDQIVWTSVSTNE
eukprot:COSAG01_NODE_1020_length_12097_cov_3.014919_12_plen_590_part_00